MNYVVMTGDKRVALYEPDNNGFNIIDEALCPLFLKRTGNFVRWIEERAIDRERVNSRMLKKAHGLSRTASDFDTAIRYNAVSITDNFWVMKDDEDLSWSDVKIEDDFYFRMAIASDDKAFSSEPGKTAELTNIGSREKGWRLEEDGWWLYKKVAVPEIEYVTMSIGRSMGFDMAVYSLCDGYVKTKDFTSQTLNLQHIDSIMGDNENYSENYRAIREFAPGHEKAYLDIICLDAIMNNPDRHTKNYGFLTSREDGHIIGLAPNYDNDMALYGSREKDFDFDPHNRLLDEFIEFIEQEEIEYAVPPPDEALVRERCSILDNGDKISEYIMKRVEILNESI